jgi:O-antigen ligase
VIAEVLAAAIGFSGLTPGLSVVTIGTVGVQPIIPLLLLYLCVQAATNLRLSWHSVIWILLVVCADAVATVFSSLSDRSAAFAFSQGLYLLLGGVALAALIAAPTHRRAFVRGYVSGALVSSVVAFGQMVYSMSSGQRIALVNNINFSLVAPVDRGSAFTPEASLLAALIIPALLCCWFERRAGDGLTAPWQRGPSALAVLALGLISTRSSSLLLLPLLFVVATFFQARSWQELTIRVTKGVLAIAIVGLVFKPIYDVRLANFDAQSSATWRYSKMLASLRIFAAHPVTGAGIGAVSDSDFFATYMDTSADLTWESDPRKGVDSTALRILAESGLLGLALTYYPVILFFRRARALARTAAFRGIMMISLGLLFAQIFMAGYRDLIVLLFGLVAFATAGDVASIADNRPEPALAGPSRRLTNWKPAR